MQEVVGIKINDIKYKYIKHDIESFRADGCEALGWFTAVFVDL